jgi:purine-binding chemotaxis protein CheW
MAPIDRPEGEPPSGPAREAQDPPPGPGAFAWEAEPDLPPGFDFPGAPDLTPPDPPPLDEGPPGLAPLLDEPAPDLPDLGLDAPELGEPPGPAPLDLFPLPDDPVGPPVEPAPPVAPSAAVGGPPPEAEAPLDPASLAGLSRLEPVEPWPMPLRPRGDPEGGEGLLDELLARAAGGDADPGLPPPLEASEEEVGEQHLVFTLAGGEFAVALANVQEIAAAPLITPLPRAPGWLLGVGNVRGDILSVLDLRAFFGLPPGGASGAGRLVVAVSRREPVAAGLLVDAVRRIVRLDAGRLEPPDGAEGSVRPYLRGELRRGSRLLWVLDLERFLLSSELRRFEAV